LKACRDTFFKKVAGFLSDCGKTADEKIYGALYHSPAEEIGA